MSLAQEVRLRLKKIAESTNHWSEFRFHSRKVRSFGVRNGVSSEMSSKTYQGLGVRVLFNGTWGFASTSDLSEQGMSQVLRTAEQMARALDTRKKTKVVIPSTKKLAQGEYFLEGYEDLFKKPLEEKFEFVKKSEEEIRHQATIEAAACQYTEVFEDKVIVTTDGADAHVRLVRPELRFLAYSADGSRRTMGYDSVGGTGGWNCLFINRKPEEFIENAVKNATNLLHAKEAQGGRKKVILSPAIVGLLCHEAIGHTVEADFVKAGSAAADKLGKVVASDLVNLCDSGSSEYQKGAGGLLPVDDEGVLTEKTYIIKKGKLTSFLHSRESSAEFGVEPTGNARAWEFSDEPLIRMRNTYIEPGKDKLADMLAGVEDGYFIDGPEGGQADATAEFMFGANKVRRIQNGKLGEYVQNVTVSGNAFTVLESVDAVSEDFKWDLGSGHCGKGQLAKVDAGGPYLRCELLIGGVQK
ncbi:MAG: TldD/PmbA family protein [Bdellovibrionales bacterium]